MPGRPQAVCCDRTGHESGESVCVKFEATAEVRIGMWGLGRVSALALGDRLAPRGCACRRLPPRRARAHLDPGSGCCE